MIYPALSNSSGTPVKKQCFLESKRASTSGAKHHNDWDVNKGQLSSNGIPHWNVWNKYETWKTTEFNHGQVTQLFMETGTTEHHLAQKCSLHFQLYWCQKSFPLALPYVEEKHRFMLVCALPSELKDSRQFVINFQLSCWYIYIPDTFSGFCLLSAVFCVCPVCWWILRNRWCMFLLEYPHWQMPKLFPNTGGFIF